MSVKYKYQDISIKKLLSTGPSKHPMKFSNSTMLRNFLKIKYTTPISQAIRSGKYIIADNSKNYYVIVSYNGIRVNADKDIQKFYDNHVWKDGKFSFQKALVIPSKEQSKENKIKHLKVGKLLSLIEIKYGGVLMAEGTQEFLELQKLIHAEGT